MLSMTVKTKATELVHAAMAVAGLTSEAQVPHLDIVADFSMDWATHGGAEFDEAVETLATFFKKGHSTN